MRFLFTVTSSLLFDSHMDELAQTDRAKRRASALMLIWCSFFVGFTVSILAGASASLAGVPPRSILHKDVQVGTDSNNQETNPTMAFAQNGNLYLVFEAVTSYSNSYLLLYRSNNNGRTWDYLTALSDTTADLREPSLALAGTTLLLAYISDDGTTAVPVVATADLSATPVTFTTHSVPVNSNYEGHSKPAIVSDEAFEGPDWNAYLVCEASRGSGNSDILYWRSQDQGGTWRDRNGNIAPEILFGLDAATIWRDPDLVYGGALFVVCVNEKATAQEIWAADLGAHGVFNPSKQRVAILGASHSFGIPSHAVAPDIEASRYQLMIVCTVESGGNDNIAYSRLSWGVWTELQQLQGQSSEHEFAPALSSNGGCFHVSYTDQHHQVSYTQLPPTRYETWQTEPAKVNDVPYASGVHTKKAITSNRQTDRATIAWADYRDGAPDYDIFSDYITWPAPVPILMLLLGD